MVFVSRNLLDCASGHDRVRLCLSDGRIVLAVFKLIMFFDQQPVWLTFARCLSTHSDQCPFALHLGAMHHELEASVPETGVYIRVPRLRLPSSLVPKHH